ncbi:MAG: carbon-nitrogen family hydrolase [Chloroflexi bacterium]|nr:carbon-nitrogen family hydrolase [Chloroflexota bacterium]
MLKVASIQLEISDAYSKERRLRHVEELLAGLAGYQLILLPEIWNIGYFSFDVYQEGGEALDGETVLRMAKQARKLGAYLFAGSLVERAGDAMYNTSVLLNPRGEVAATYRKMHLFGYGSAEATLLSRGEEIVAVPTKIGTLGLSTCYDLRFPELYRKLVDKGAEVFLVASAWPYPRLEHWKALNRVRAFENQCFLISSNCVGVNRGSRFCGHSAIVDPWGVPVASGGDHETVLKAEIDVQMVHRVRADFPALQDRVIPI